MYLGVCIFRSLAYISVCVFGVSGCIWVCSCIYVYFRIFLHVSGYAHVYVFVCLFMYTGEWYTTGSLCLCYSRTYMEEGGAALGCLVSCK